MMLFQVKKLYLVMLLLGFNNNATSKKYLKPKTSKKKFHSQSHLPISNRVSMKDMPFVVKIFMREGRDVENYELLDPEKTGFCTGVILSKNVILTAASCLEACGHFFLMKNITVRVGQDYNPSAFKKGRGDPYEDHHIYSVTTPNAWNGDSPMEGTKCHTGKNQGVFNTYHWNFVLITLEGQISDSFFTNGKAAVADLPYAATQIVNPVVIAGYGSTGGVQRGDTVYRRAGWLHAQYHNAYTKSECKKQWQAYYNFAVPNEMSFAKKPFPEDFICANYTVKICDDGGTGGPMFQCIPSCDKENCEEEYPDCSTRAVVLGIAAFTQNDADDCSVPKLAMPIWLRATSSNVFNRERKVGAYFTDIRVHLDFIKGAIDGAADYLEENQHNRKYRKPSRQGFNKQNKNYKVYGVLKKLKSRDMIHSQTRPKKSKQ